MAHSFKDTNHWVYAGLGEKAALGIARTIRYLKAIEAAFKEPFALTDRQVQEASGLSHLNFVHHANS